MTPLAKLLEAALFASGRPIPTDELAALDEATSSGARMTQLEAATRLARLAKSTGRTDAATRLRDVFETFTEGFETPALREARAVLDEAAAGRA